MKKKNLKKLDFEKSDNFLDGLEKIKNVIEKVEKDEEDAVVRGSITITNPLKIQVQR